MSKPDLEQTYIPRLLEKYRKELLPSLREKFGFKNALSCPRLTKIVVNMGCGEAAHNQDILEQLLRDLAVITGQKPKVCRAKKPISNFKIRKGQPVGLKVTLRGKIMYEFLDRFITFAVPRIRDFRGFPTAGFDEGGNYTLGIDEHTIFPEVDLDKAKHIQGMNITFCIDSGSVEESFELLKGFGFPFRVR